MPDRRRRLSLIEWLWSDRRWMALAAGALVLAPLVWARQGYPPAVRSEPFDRKQSAAPV